GPARAGASGRMLPSARPALPRRPDHPTHCGRTDAGRMPCCRQAGCGTGALVARFHRAGIWHADLNAHNVLVTSSALHLIDFDRGRLRVPAEGWRLANLKRLHRSLLKLGAAAQGEEAFRESIWTPLLDAYEATFGA